MHTQRNKPAVIVLAVALVAAVMTAVPLLAGWSLGRADAAGGGIDNVVPKPVSVTAQEGRFTLSGSSRILYADRAHPTPTEQSLAPLAEVLAGELELVTGVRPSVVAGGPADAAPGDIVLVFDEITADAPTEAEQIQAYALDVTDRAVVSSQWYKGVAYGTATLLQAMVEQDGAFVVPGVLVADEPASGYRAVMLDVARKYHSLPTLLEVVDMLRLYKTRYLHLHLTDNEAFAYPYAPVTDALEGRNHSMTRAEFETLVAYADARGVTIIPELDLPGHSGKLRDSGYVDAEGDYDVAQPRNHAPIKRIIDDMSAMFASSPYFHIGGDESAAGGALVPFLSEMNAHIRSLNKRMIVWEGFGGAPVDQVPATGDDRVIVMQWAGGYFNPPWVLAEAGYELINAGFSPMYVVGTGNDFHIHSRSYSWSPAAIYLTDADTYVQNNYSPIFDNLGPGDPDRTDRTWKLSYIGREDQGIGGSLLFWEQAERGVMPYLHDRLAVASERWWNPDGSPGYDDLMKRWDEIDDRMMTIVRPVEILPESAEPESAINQVYRVYQGDSLDVTMVNRSRVEGVIHYETTECCGQLHHFGPGAFPALPTTDSAAYTGPVTIEGGKNIRARLFRPDGTPVGGAELATFNNWPALVEVTEYDVPIDEYDDLSEVDSINTDDWAGREKARYRMPMLRGQLDHVETHLERREAILAVEEGGQYSVSLTVTSGRGDLYLDLDQDGAWGADEKVVANTPYEAPESGTSAPLQLAPGQYRLRVDAISHQSNSVLHVLLNGPDTDGTDADVSNHLVPLGDPPPAPPTTVAPAPPTTVTPSTTVALPTTEAPPATVTPSTTVAPPTTGTPPTTVTPSTTEAPTTTVVPSTTSTAPPTTDDPSATTSTTAAPAPPTTVSSTTVPTTTVPSTTTPSTTAPSTTSTVAPPTSPTTAAPPSTTAPAPPVNVWLQLLLWLLVMFGTGGSAGLGL